MMEAATVDGKWGLAIKTWAQIGEMTKRAPVYRYSSNPPRTPATPCIFDSWSGGAWAAIWFDPTHSEELTRPTAPTTCVAQGQWTESSRAIIVPSYTTAPAIITLDTFCRLRQPKPARLMLSPPIPTCFRRGVSAFEQWCAQHCAADVSFEQISQLYDDPSALHVLPSPRLRMMARAMIEQHTLMAYDEVGPPS